MSPAAAESTDLQQSAASGGSGGGTTGVATESGAQRTAGTASVARFALPAAGVAASLALVATVRRSARPPAFDRGEDVLFRSRPRRSVARTVFSLGTWELVRRSTWFAVTDRRVLVERGLLVRRSRSVPLSAIADVDAKTGPWEGTVRVAAHDGKVPVLDMGPLRSRVARTVAAAIVLEIARGERRRPGARR